ncbi:TIGR03545 family protein [Natronospirillum operosum]|uniref:TIGR03545 family protein n=1 Tax=Natronospirillum operosum TaxID=2759953 RepID=A0A4Z0WDH2_9GAMM|nr:TIGR03545 family protein [Natronospirillum operosum]TGG95100.1 TIGR03545 family protein [Natronospirillum operosum]
MAGITSFTRLFRWGGLIPFVAVVGGLWIGGYLFADVIARSLLQSNLTRIQGAQVDVGNADVAWQPFGLVVDDIQMTDPNRPSHNAVQVGQVAMQLDLWALLTGKVLVESLAVDELRFDTERASPGRVITRAPKPQREGPTAAQRAMDTVDLPSPRDALERHGPLETEARAAAATATRERVVGNVSERGENLPDDQTLASYRQRVEQLQNRNLNSLDAIQQVRAEVSELTAAVATDRLAMEQFLNSVESGQRDIRSALNELLAGPGEDIAAILNTYNLTPDGQIALAGLLLGEQWAQWIEQGQQWYATALPWIERLLERRRDSQQTERRGVDSYFVLFPEENPVPRFWLREARISAHTDGGDWGGRIVDLSSNPVLIDRPAVMEARSTRLDAAEAAQLDMIWDRRQGNQLDVQFNIDRWRVSGWQLDHDELPVGLRSAQTDMSLDASWQNGWTGGMNWQFGQTRFGMPAEWRSGNLLRQALESVNQFDVRADFSGNAVFPRTRWSSDLDDRVASAVRAAVGAQVAEWEGQLRAELDDRRRELEAPVRAELERLDAQRVEWERKRDALDNDVRAALASLEQRAVDERRAVEQRLDQERREAERRARQEIENRARDALRF